MDIVVIGMLVAIALLSTGLYGAWGLFVVRGLASDWLSDNPVRFVAVVLAGAAVVIVTALGVLGMLVFGAKHVL